MVLSLEILFLESLLLEMVLVSADFVLHLLLLDLLQLLLSLKTRQRFVPVELQDLLVHVLEVLLLCELPFLFVDQHRVVRPDFLVE